MVVESPESDDFEWIVNFFPRLSEFLTPEQYLALDSIVAIVGDRGVGKTSLVNALMEEDRQLIEQGGRPVYNRVPETMTRLPRTNEVDGVHMRHMDESEFLARLDQDKEIFRRHHANEIDILENPPFFLAAYHVWRPDSELRKVAGIQFSDFIDALSLTLRTSRINLLITAAQVAMELKVQYEFLKVYVIEAQADHQRQFLLSRGDDPSYIAGKPMGPGDYGYSTYMQRTAHNKPDEFGALCEDMSKRTRYLPLASLLPVMEQLQRAKEKSDRRRSGDLSDSSDDEGTDSLLAA